MSRFRRGVLADLLRRGELPFTLAELDRWQRVLKMPLSNLVRGLPAALMVKRLIGAYCCAVHDWITPPRHASGT